MHRYPATSLQYEVLSNTFGTANSEGQLRYDGQFAWYVPPKRRIIEVRRVQEKTPYPYYPISSSI